MNSILVLFAHPAFEQSKMNRRMRAAALDLDGVTFHDLYEEYPDFDVDVRREQVLLMNHDVIVLQHPFYWYSAPALMKQWLDLVLEHGWAYGKSGNALRGKVLLSAVTAGGSANAYAHDGYHEATMDELLTPFRQTARLCQMTYERPFVVHGTFTMSDREMTEAARHYRTKLDELSGQDRTTSVPRHCRAESS